MPEERESGTALPQVFSAHWSGCTRQDRLRCNMGEQLRRSRMNWNGIFLAAALLPPFIALAGDSPSVSAGRDALSKMWTSGDKCVRVSDFKKTDGQSSEVFGVRYYAMDYSAQLTFIAPCYAEYNGERKRFSLPPRSTRDFLSQNSKTFQPGETVMIQGRLNFEKKESGWRHQSGMREERKTSDASEEMNRSIKEVLKPSSKKSSGW